MFQTELILFLQSFETNFFTFFFQFWSDLGYSQWTSLLMLVFFFGISFRYGFVMMQAMILNGLTTLGLKEVFALPRPAHVDIHVKLIDQGTPNLTPFESQGAQRFFERLPEDVLASIRSNPPQSWGFPSGHTSNATTLGGLLFFFTKKTWVKIVSLAILVFVPLSRMYLGRHFLADVLGGYVIGLVFVFIFYRGVVRSTWLYAFLSRKPRKFRWDIKIMLFFVYMCAFPFLLLILPNINHQVVAALLGLNLGFLLVWKKGIPEDKGTIWQRIARVLLALTVYLLADQMLERVSQIMFEPAPKGVVFFLSFLTILLCVWGSTELSIKLSLFKRHSR
jgi:membrane-associated phospholipid phosphatase